MGFLGCGEVSDDSAVWKGVGMGGGVLRGYKFALSHPHRPLSSAESEPEEGGRVGVGGGWTVYC